ncbi:class I SAM-dependent methyltransferase [Streptomyces sp. NPDC048644]|uniref:class I SAM-dependent methyltransferase n=1 Tax=Streptomyces sp. NPDC048644 TaxID=3365582 RepID=UPI003717B524
MTGPCAGHDAAVTDRSTLTGSAYRNDRALAARQSLYRWQAPRYDLPGLVMEELKALRGTVVDVGCGNGRFIQRIRAGRPDLRLLGLDVSAGILDGVPGHVGIADAERLPLRSHSVAAALALHMLYHVRDIPQAVGELSRVITERGIVIASTNSDRDKSELNQLWERAAGDVLGREKGPSRISLSARFSLEKARDLLGEAFGTVRSIDLPGTITVRSAEPVVAHMESYRAWADHHEVPFAPTIERAREIVDRHIAQHGAFSIEARGGLLVCSR